MEGFQVIGVNIFGINRLCGIGVFWIRRLLLGSFGTALMPLRPFILQPHFDPFA
jgi:hypothetical protein